MVNLKSGLGNLNLKLEYREGDDTGRGGDLRTMHYTVVWRCYRLYKHETHASCGVLRCYTSTKRMCGLAPPSGHQRRRVRRRGWCAARRRCRRLAAPLCLLRRRLLASSTTTACASAAALWSHACRGQQVRGVLGMGCTRCMSVTSRILFFYLACGMCQNAKKAGQLKSWKWSTFENVQQNELLHVDFSQSNLPFRRPLQVMCAQN